jgi:hypothetical protein
MLEALSAAESAIEELLIDLMTKRVMLEREVYTGVQVSSMRGLQASLSTTCARLS